MNIIVYSTPTCGYCRMVKEFFKQKGITFEEKDVSNNHANAEEMIKSSGQTGVPVTVIDGQVVVGFDRERLEQLLAQTKTKQHPSFGVAVADASKITARQGLEIKSGAYVGNVRTGSVAEKVGLKSGDIITEINRQRITSAVELENALSILNNGSRFSLVFLRDNKEVTANGTL